MPLILLAIDACSSFEPLLPMALLMASQQHAAVRGVFFSDMRLLQGAGLPITHEIGANSAACYAVTSNSIERRIQHIANQMRHRLAVEAERQHVPWEFEISSGSISKVAREAEADIVLTGWNTNFATSLAHVGSAVPKSRQRPVVAIDDGSPGSKDILLAARHLAGDNRKNLPLIVLKIHNSAEDSAKTSGMLDEIEGAAGQAAAAEKTFHVASRAQMIAYLRMLRPSLIVLGRNQLLMDDQQFQRTLATLKCPVALLKLN